MKKILSILVCVCVLLSAMVITASAAGTEVAKFEFGDNGATGHVDGQDLGSSKTYTNNGYELKLTNMSKCYGPAKDETGTSALKLGTSSVVGSFSFTAPDDVTSVIFKVAKYKAKNTTVVINGTNYDINTSSNDGAYTDITIDTTATKNITFATASSSKARCMIDSITYVVAETTGGEPACTHTDTYTESNGDETHKVVCNDCGETVNPTVDCADADINGKCDTCTGNVALPEEKTIKDVLAMADGDTKFYVTAEIVDTYRDTWATYGNFILKDDSTDETIIMYGLHDEAGNQYDAMETKPVVGDTIKVLANRSSYKGVGQLANAVLVELIPATPDEGGEDVTPPADDEGGEDVTPPADDATLEVVDTPVAGTAYKFGMVQGNLENAVYYLAGGMDGYYMATTTDAEAAIDIYVEETDGGYYLYTMVDSAKAYINMVTEEKDGRTFVNGAYEATASTVYTYDADAKTMVATVNDELYWFATRNDNTYTTLGPAKVSYEGFYGQFYAEPVVDDGKDDTTDDNTTTGGATTGGTTGGTTTGGATTGGSTTNNNVNTNTNTDNSTTSPDTGDNVGAFAVMAIAAAAVVIAASKKRA